VVGGVRFVGEVIASIGATEIWKDSGEALGKLPLPLTFFFSFPCSLPVASLHRGSHPLERNAVFYP